MAAQRQVDDRIDDQLVVALEPADDRADFHAEARVGEFRHQIIVLNVEAIEDFALARVGLVLGLEVSRLARNNADWHRLIDLAGLTDTLIGDADGIYHPALFNDRLVLGMKGTMSEAEIHILRARLDGGIRNKAARGQLRKELPVGLVWGEAEGRSSYTPTRRSVG